MTHVLPTVPTCDMAAGNVPTAAIFLVELTQLGMSNLDPNRVYRHPVRFISLLGGDERRFA